MRAACCETASRRRVLQCRRTTRNTDLLALIANARQGVNQHLRVRMDRVIKDRIGRAKLDDAAGIHDRHAVRNLIMHAHIVADDDHGVLELLLQAHQHLQNTLLHNNVQSGGRFVGKHDIRGHKGRKRDDNTLAHTAGKLERIRFQNIRGKIQLLEVFCNTCEGLLFRFVLAVFLRDRIQKLLFQSNDRVQNALRGLRNVRNVVPPGLLNVSGFIRKGLSILFAAENNLTFVDLQRELDNIVEGLQQCGLAAAGFTGDAEYLVIVDLKVQVVKDVNVTVDELVRSGQIFDF